VLAECPSTFVADGSAAHNSHSHLSPSPAHDPPV
jgi:hypothetical protein